MSGVRGERPFRRQPHASAHGGKLLDLRADDDNGGGDDDDDDGDDDDDDDG